jgi:hypothetical protein
MLLLFFATVEIFSFPHVLSQKDMSKVAKKILPVTVSMLPRTLKEKVQLAKINDRNSFD